MAGLAVDHRDELARHCRGVGRLLLAKVIDRIDRVDWLIAVILSPRLREVASIMGDKELRLYVKIALNLHEFQHTAWAGIVRCLGA